MAAPALAAPPAALWEAAFFLLFFFLIITSFFIIIISFFLLFFGGGGGGGGAFRGLPRNSRQRPRAAPRAAGAALSPRAGGPRPRAGSGAAAAPSPARRLPKRSVVSEEMIHYLFLDFFFIRQTVGLAVAMGSSLCELSELCGNSFISFPSDSSFFLLLLLRRNSSEDVHQNVTALLPINSSCKVHLIRNVNYFTK